MKHCYFENRDCDYYPCHDAEHINCMFCFCPLYPKEDCGGDFVMKDGEKRTAVPACVLMEKTAMIMSYRN